MVPILGKRRRDGAATQTEINGTKERKIKMKDKRKRLRLLLRQFGVRFIGHSRGRVALGSSAWLGFRCRLGCDFCVVFTTCGLFLVGSLASLVFFSFVLDLCSGH